MCPGFCCAYHVIIEIHCEIIPETWTDMLHKAKVLPLHRLGNIFSLNLLFPTALDSRSIQLFQVGHFVSNLKPHSTKCSFPGYVGSAHSLVA